MFAAIDIGSNTILLLVAEMRKKKVISLEERQRIPRLGKDMEKRDKLSKKAIRRTTRILQEYQSMVKNKYSSEVPVIVTATSAVREASNRDRLLDHVYRHTGLQIEILTGEQEARLTYAGALSTLRLKTLRNRLVVDVGGGSTELIYGTSKGIQQLYSFPMGSVRYTERYIRPSNSPDDSVAECRKSIYQLLQSQLFNHSFPLHLIAVEGTATSLAYISSSTDKSYRSSLINGQILRADKLRDLVRWLIRTKPASLLDQYPEVMKGRADVFLAGVLILEAVVHHFSVNELTISAGGIRHGSILGYVT